MEDEAKLKEFMSVTGVDKERAKFFLDANGWNVEMATSSFYEDDDEPVILTGEEAGSGGASNASQAAVASPEAPAGSAGSRAGGRTGSSRPAGGVHTLSNMVDISSDSDEEQRGQAFYAGGSEHSGQQILGPRRPRADGEQIVREMFKAAREHGAEEVPSASRAADEPGRSRIVFSGAGYRLDQSAASESTVAAAGGSGATAAAASAAGRQQQRQPRHVLLRLWRSGFSVDDGPLREFSDPANQQFLDDIRSGHIPRELVHEARGAEVHLDMEDHRTEEYVKPRPVLKAFSGQGHTLGSPVPNVVGAPASTAAAAAAASSCDLASCEAAAAEQLAVDASAAVTTVQVRLDDGSRLRVKLNATHTLVDLQHYIETARPQYRGRTISLRAAFPSRQLTDLSVTIEQAQLLNAAVIAQAH